MLFRIVQRVRQLVAPLMKQEQESRRDPATGSSCRDIIKGRGQYTHLIPLGDNCELSFIVNELGYTGGSFFKWANCEISAVIEILRNDFGGVFEFDSLEPYSRNLVVDTKYDIKFHTEMKSIEKDGAREFESGLDLGEIYTNERQKRDYLVEKWTRMVGDEKGRCLYLIKKNSGLTEEEINRLYLSLIHI